MSDNPETRTCAMCGGDVAADDPSAVHFDNGDIVCRDCYDDDDPVQCYHCGRLYPSADMHEVFCDANPRDYCPECFERGSTHCCSVCDEYFDSDDNGIYNDWSDAAVCGGCMDNGWSVCDGCGCVSDELDEYGNCPECRDDCEEHSGLRGNHCNPELRFYMTDAERDQISTPLFPNFPVDGGATPLPYLGFELEVDVRSGVITELDQDDLAVELEDERYCWCKDDGSLNRGVEMVSQPMTLAFHKQFGWDTRLNTIRRAGYRSYQADSSCGLHVHVNRDFLPTDSWVAISDFINTPSGKSLAHKVAQRHNNSYALFYSDVGCSTPEEQRNFLINGHTRYGAMNFTNDSTIEFRLFKGTLKYSTFISILEFVDALVRYGRKALPENELSVPEFLGYIADHSGPYAELTTYLQSKGYYPRSLVEYDPDGDGVQEAADEA